MKFCKRCLYPATHPLFLVLDEQGICSGCRVHEEKYTLDWNARLGLLKQKVSELRRAHSHYDCVIPVSGAKDSFFIVHFVKNVLGLNPLLVGYNAQYNTPVGIRNLARLRTIFDCDFLGMTVNPESAKKITRRTMEKFGSMYWHILAGETVFPVQIAVRFKIPFIVFGAMQGLDQVGMYSHTDEVELMKKYRKEHDLMGDEAEDLGDAFADLTKNELDPYRYPEDDEIWRAGVRGLYLGNYIPWDSKAQHELMIKQYGYESAREEFTFDTYNHIDSFHYSGLHDYTKLLKHGYSKVTDHASREIRLKRLSREDGIALVKRYTEKLQDPKNLKDLKLFSFWIGMGESEILNTLERFRNPLHWENGRLKNPVWNEVMDPSHEAARLPVEGKCEFVETPVKGLGVESADRYTLIGKGFVHEHNFTTD